YSGYFYDEFAQVMARDRVVLCPDTPGFGGSERPPSRVGVTDYALAFADVLLGLGYGEGAAGAVDVLGFHTGAVLAAELGIERPALVNRVLLIGLPFYVDDARQTALHAELARDKAYMDDIDALGQEWRAYVEWQGHKLSRERLLSLFAEQLRAGRQLWWPYDAVFTWPGRTRLPKLGRPTLLLAEGEALYQTTVDAKAFIPNATLWEYPEIQAPAFNAYHEELAAAVRRFTDPACKC
ncbi:MAG: alpha/beta fold hydrolase, partial [Gammaproteobacteria bacterium]|nr:alpha/beta fold hydrolase [Gammaproteobacteria bacterium]